MKQCLITEDRQHLNSSDLQGSSFRSALCSTDTTESNCTNLWDESSIQLRTIVHNTQLMNLRALDGSGGSEMLELLLWTTFLTTSVFVYIVYIETLYSVSTSLVYYF